MDTAPAGTRDFAAYWASARLLLAGANPYSATSLLDLQRSIGLTEPTPLFMWNPPWALTFVLPFGLLGFTTAQFSWLLLQSIFLAFSAHHLWKIYSNSGEPTWIPWMLAFTFIPAVYALVLGQITPMVLFGITSFVLLERRQRWLGASLILVVLAVKPHFIYLFWIVLILWLVQEKHWHVMRATTILGLVVGIIPLLLDPLIYMRYLEVLQSADYRTPLDLPAPTLRNALIVLFETESVFVQFLPTFAGIVWMISYWRSHRTAWIWSEHLPMILLVSVVTSPYTWTFDQTVLLTAIIQAFVWFREKVTQAMLGYFLFNGAYLAMRYWVSLDFWYFWMAPLFLVIYVILRKRAHQRSTRSTAIAGAARAAAAQRPKT